MCQYLVTVRTKHGITKVTVEAHNPGQARDIASAYGEVISLRQL